MLGFYLAVVWHPAEAQPKPSRTNAEQLPKRTRIEVEHSRSSPEQFPKNSRTIPEAQPNPCRTAPEALPTSFYPRLCLGSARRDPENQIGLVTALERVDINSRFAKGELETTSLCSIFDTACCVTPVLLPRFPVSYIAVRTFLSRILATGY